MGLSKDFVPNLKKTTDIMLWVLFSEVLEELSYLDRTALEDLVRSAATKNRNKEEVSCLEQHLQKMKVQ